MDRKKEIVELTSEELKELHVFFDYELHSAFIGWTFLLFIVAGILTVAKLEITEDSVFIYLLFRVFVVSLIVFAFLTAYCVSILLAMFLIKHGRFKLFRPRRNLYCINHYKSELKGKQCLILHVLYFRYAFRIEDV